MTVTDLHTFPSPSITTRRPRPVAVGRDGPPRDSRQAARLAPMPPRVLDAVVAAAVLGSIAILGMAWIDTARGSWYSALQKPRFTGAAPQVLGLGWSAVCGSVAVAVWLLARQRDRRREVVGALVAFLVQIVLLLAWVWAFFVGHQIGRSFAVAIALIVASTVTVAAFGRISRGAGALMVPALTWAAAVAALAGGLTLLN